MGDHEISVQLGGIDHRLTIMEAAALFGRVQDALLGAGVPPTLSREALLAALAEYRGVGQPCPACAGMGVHAYSSTTTWRGGGGGQAITQDVCDRCWGSGDAAVRWLDLRELAATPRVWRYLLPSIRGEGWAIVVLSQEGLFAAVSDFGNYAHHWTAVAQDDFRRFVVGLEAGYLMSKLGRRDWYDGEATYKALLAAIAERRRAKTMTRDEARDLREAAKRRSELHTEADLHGWFEETGPSYDLVEDLVVRDYPPDLRGFAARILPRLQAKLREDLGLAPAAVRARPVEAPSS